MKVQLPWIGKAAGSSAGTIYQSYWGRTFARSFPSIFHYPDTPAQQVCQAHFHDIRRVWSGYFRDLEKSAEVGQRANRNIYNIYLSAIFKVFNPYGVPRYTRPPKSFGLDRYNRMRATMSGITTEWKSNAFIIRWKDWEVNNSIKANPSLRMFLVVDRTKQNLHIEYQRISPSYQSVTIYNAYGWEPGDEMFIYVAISSNHWLGNFNLCDL